MIGWISLHRCLLEKVIWKYTTPQQKTILVTLLLMADHKENDWIWMGEKFITKPGQFITSLDSIVEKAGKGITVKMVRTSLKKFEKYEFLADKSTKTGRLITITNWDSYQNFDDKGAKKKAKRGQRGGKERAPNNNVNNETKEKDGYFFPKEFSDNLINKFCDFIENRKVLKKPVTEKAFTGLINKLKKLSNGNEKASIEIINESIINGWGGLFPLKTNNKFKPEEKERHINYL